MRFTWTRLCPATGKFTAKWSAEDKNIHIESTNLAEMAWWKKFNDPQLNQLIESALQNNNNLQMAMGNILQAQASLKKIQMGWLPTVSMGEGWFYWAIL